MNKNSELSTKIKHARVLANLSQKDLANKLGFSDKTISAYETGRAIPPIPTLEKIALLTNKPIEEFLNGQTITDQEQDILEKKLDIIIAELKNISQKL